MEAGNEGNSITFLRLVLALMVVFGHSYVIGGFGPEPVSTWSLQQTSSQEMAVKGFFILSGFLLSHSLARSSSLSRFAIRRFFRIMPAFWVLLLFSALVAAPLMAWMIVPGSDAGYFSILRQGDQSPLGYLRNNVFLWIGQDVIAVPQSPLPVIENGSLWSLFYEALCYALLAACAWTGLTRRRAGVFALFGILYLPCLVYQFHPFQALPMRGIFSIVYNFGFHPSGTRVALAFSAGMAAYAITGGRRFWNPKHFILAVLILALGLTYGGFGMIWPLVFPYVLLSLAYGLPLPGFGRLGDASYGVYLYASMVQHWLCLFGVDRSGLPVYLGASVLLSLAFGILSWLLVERWAIGLGGWIIVRHGLGGRKNPPATLH